ncbi:MAG: ABC transporter ATP-binding protein [Clostridia bacterium]|nr:ABC transporter ATP-binding protein [Clostridia bacterium]
MKRNVKKTKTSKSVLRRVLGFLKPYAFLTILSIILSGASVFLTLYLPILIGQAIDLIIEAGNVDFEALVPLLFRGGIAVVVTAVLTWIISTINNKITFEVIRDVRREAFKKLQLLPVSYIDSHPFGDIVSRIVSDVDTFADGLLLGFTQLFTGVLTILGTLIFMFYLSPIIALIVVVLTPLSLFVARYVSKHTYDMFKLQSETRGEQTSLIDEAIGQQKVVKAFGREDEIMEKYCEIDERLVKCSLKATFFSSLVNPSTRFVNSVVYAAVGCFGALSVIGRIGILGSMSVGTLSVFLSYANQYTKPFNEISGVITELQNSLACAGRIFDFIAEKPQTPDKEDAVALNDVKGAVRLENVSFSYTPEQKLIENLSLDVKPGQRIAIVGPTGCGKTTVINLLMRFYDVREGKIFLDGVETRDMTRHDLRSSVGMVLQDTWLAAGTVRDNIKMGKPEATDEEIIEAAKAAHAHSFIKRLPNGYDTELGEDGGSLSQGQKQLLCIARVMLCLPPMLILDEATSSIDTRTETRIQKAFATMMEGRTSFIVAHRLSTIREADIILVMKDGNVIEKGSHDDLLASGGFYATLYNSQFETT